MKLTNLIIEDVNLLGLDVKIKILIFTTELNQHCS